MTDLSRIETQLRLAGLQPRELQYAGYNVIAHIAPAADNAAGIDRLKKRGVSVYQAQPTILLVSA